jgi:hypothetical protein
VYVLAASAAVYELAASDARRYFDASAGALCEIAASVTMWEVFL